MDYVKHFRLEREPFQNDLDGRFFFEGASQRRARMQLMRALQQHKGMALLLGGPGLGKTTLAHHLLRDLDARRFAAHLLLASHRECAHGWFLPQVARMYGVPAPAARVPDLIEQIHERLLALCTAGRHPVLFVDEAQLLAEPQALEEFRALLNLAHEGRRVFSLLLFGTDELGGVLALDASLAQRVDVRVRLAPLTAGEVGTYLAHRVAQAAGPEELLSSDAVEALYLYSGGVPRVLNTLADNACFEAALEACATVGAVHVAAAAQQLDLPASESERAAAGAATAFHRVSAQAAAARLEPESRIGDLLESTRFACGAEAPGAEEPLFGEHTAETLGTRAAAPEEDWLEPVAPVLDAVLRSFDDSSVRTRPAEDLGVGAEPEPMLDETRISDAAGDDPLTWSFADSDTSAVELEVPTPRSPVVLDAPASDAGDDDSIANLSFAEELPAEAEDVLELGPALLDPDPVRSEEPPAANRSRGPRIDLPEDDDLDSLFDEIQIDS